MESSGPFGIREALKRQAQPGVGELAPPLVLDPDEDANESITREPNRFALFDELRTQAKEHNISLPEQSIVRFLELSRKESTSLTPNEYNELDQILSMLRQRVESPDTVEVPAGRANAAEPVPANLQELQNIVATPVTVAEVPDKETFMRDIYPWVANALLAAGYDYEMVDRQLAKSLDQIDFTQLPEKYVEDINRILQNILQQSLLDQGVTRKPEGVMVEAMVPGVPEENSPQSVADNQIHLPPEQTVSMAVPPPIINPLVLTPEMRVLKVHESVVEQTDIPSERTEVPEAPSEARDYQLKLDDLNSQPFQRDAYLEYMLALHTELNERYSAVVALGRANLKRFDGTYVPSPTEKAALQLLSSLQGHYAKMQRADSEIGIRRAELMNSLNRSDEQTDEATVKIFTQQYLDATKKFFANINKLEALIAVAMREEKASVTDTYREQLRQVHDKGLQVLSHLTPDLPHRQEFMQLVQEDMATAVKEASAEADGDRALRERAPYFTSMRDRVTTAIEFVKHEAEYEEQRARVARELPVLLATYDRLKILPTSSDKIKQDFERVTSDITALLSLPEVLPTNTAFHYIAPAVFTEAAERLSVQMGSLTENVILARQYVGLLEEAAGITGREVAAPNEQVPEHEETPPLPPRLETLLLDQHYRVDQVRATVAVEKVAPSLIKRLLTRLRPRKVGMVAGVALFSAAIPTATDINSVQALSPGTTAYSAGVGEVAGVATAETIDAAAILAYLRSIEPAPLTIAPTLPQPEQVIDVIPQQTVTPVEVVPGVIFPHVEQSISTEMRTSVSGLSPLANRVPLDPGIDLTPQVDESVPDQMYTIEIGDTFWDINEGQSIAGKLPVMSEINPSFKQKLIAEMRSRLAKDSEMRKIIGGMGDTADIIYAGQMMNITKLNDFARIVAVEIGYLQ